jgi:hypothetical protein
MTLLGDDSGDSGGSLIVWAGMDSTVASSVGSMPCVEQPPRTVVEGRSSIGASAHGSQSLPKASLVAGFFQSLVGHTSSKLNVLLDFSVLEALHPKPNALLDLGQGGDAGQVSDAYAIRNCLELELFSEEEPTPLSCCPAVENRGKTRKRSLDWALQLVKEFSHFVGLSCDGFEGKLLALFEDILASNDEQGAGPCSNVGKKGMRELNSLFCSINYDAHSGNVSRGRSKGRVQRGFYEA